MHSINLLHSRHGQWLRVQHVKGQTGDLRSIYKSMVAGARSTETDEKGGEWRPVPLGLPREIWAWTPCWCTDPVWPDSGHYYGVHWGIYTADGLLEYILLDTNYYLIFIDQTIIFSLVTKKEKGFGSYYERHIPAVCRGKSLCFFVFLGWLCLSCLGIS